ncbi:SDR family oxidoreductase [Chelatococcus sp. GCM10030263]|uniref:SDR family oxidoreductase n=1 Tax=Chelatococcus sp. GCM10030263 TaxID=3273387 RepID=UPI0036219CD5
MTNEVALVTGGARRIGRAIALTLARAGYAVAVHYGRSGAEAQSVVDEIRQAGSRADAFAADLAAHDAPTRLIEAADSALGPVTLLVNSASLFEPDTLPALSEDLWQAHMTVNLRAPIFLAQQMAARLPAGRSGAIVNLLDQRVRKLTPDFFSYTLAKAALATATCTMAQALAPRIRVNGVAPGPTLPSKRQTPEVFARQRAAALLGHGPSVDEIAEAVLYLARARSITGQVLAVDGGQHLVWRTPDAEVGE